MSARGFDWRRVSELAGRRTAEKPGSRPAFRFHPHVQRVAIGAELETKQVVAPSIRTPKAVASLCLSHLFLKDHKLELHAFFQP
jgi:hypothetical protein